MSPEKFELGAAIDEVTNVYLMGQAAFALFSDSNRSEAAWPLNKKLYNVVKKAISNNRKKRQQSINQFTVEWKTANESNNSIG